MQSKEKYYLKDMIIEQFRRLMGWCPKQHTLKAQICDSRPSDLISENHHQIMPPSRTPAIKTGLHREIIMGLIIGCMVLLCLIGFPWWAFFVLTILIVSVASGYLHWYHHLARRA
jgi:hypothetical protein